MRAWLAAIHRQRSAHNQTLYYSRLMALVDFYSRWHILPFDDRAADEFTALRKQGVRIGTMDLKIAAIALTHGALLPSGNRRDFDRVPGLRVEGWAQ